MCKVEIDEHALPLNPVDGHLTELAYCTFGRPKPNTTVDLVVHR